MVKPKGHDRPTKYKSKHNNSNHVEVKKDSKSKILFTFLTITCIGVAGWCSYRGYLETRVNTPFDQDKVFLQKTTFSSKKYLIKQKTEEQIKLIKLIEYQEKVEMFYENKNF